MNHQIKTKCQWQKYSFESNQLRLSEKVHEKNFWKKVKSDPGIFGSQMFLKLLSQSFILFPPFHNLVVVVHILLTTHHRSQSISIGHKLIKTFSPRRGWKMRLQRSNYNDWAKSNGPNEQRWRKNKWWVHFKQKLAKLLFEGGSITQWLAYLLPIPAASGSKHGSRGCV